MTPHITSYTSNFQNWYHFWKILMSIWHSLISILGWHGFESSLEVGFLPFWQKLGLKTYSMQIFLNAKFVKVCNRNGTRLKIVHRNHKVYKILSRENIVMVGKTLYVNNSHFLTFPADLQIRIFFSNLNSNCSNLLDLRNHQE